MTVVVVESVAKARGALSLQLGELGCRVAPFADARVALLYLLGRLGEVDRVIVSEDAGQGTWLLRRLALLREPPPVMIYSRGDTAEGAEIRRKPIERSPRRRR